MGPYGTMVLTAVGHVVRQTRQFIQQEYFTSWEKYIRPAQNSYLVPAVSMIVNSRALDSIY